MQSVLLSKLYQRRAIYEAMPEVQNCGVLMHASENSNRTATMGWWEEGKASLIERVTNKYSFSNTCAALCAVVTKPTSETTKRIV
jgi:hypothetical protein